MKYGMHRQIVEKDTTIEASQPLAQQRQCFWIILEQEAHTDDAESCGYTVMDLYSLNRMNPDKTWH